MSRHDAGTAPRASRFGGTDRYVADYLRTEFLSRLRRSDHVFLRRTSILEALTGPLCDAVLHDNGSEGVLKRLARADLVVCPLAGRRGWYRFQPLFRDLLLRELLEEEPQAIPTLRRRAAAWHEAAGDIEAALEHAEAAGDADRVATIIAATAFSASSRGRGYDLERRLARFDRAQLERHPAVAAHGSRVHAFRGRAAEAQRWLEIAEWGARRRRRDAAVLRPQVAAVRAALCRDGPRRMLGDAGAALAGLPRDSQWYPFALQLRGCAALLLGATDEADSLLADAAATAGMLGCPETQMLAVAQRSLLAREGGDLDRGDALSTEARRIAADDELEGTPTFAIALAAAARASLRQGRWAEARALVVRAEKLTPLVTEALPWLAVGARLELARCYLELRDPAAARRPVTEIRAILDARPRLGALAERALALGHEAGLVLSRSGASGRLTPAELRLLPLLATHLSFREIAEQLEVSRNTVKTQAISIYRKLGVSCRSEAIAAAAPRPQRAA